MQAALLLIDLQQDYLQSANLEPHAGLICSRAAYLLGQFRNDSRPIVHVWTTIRHESERMPHWRERGVQRCVEGSVGHRTPTALQPMPDELVVHKRFFSAFSCADLLPYLQARKIHTLVLAGLFLRACIRTTAIDAYQNGFSVIVADDAVGDDDPIHAAVTRQYLEQRSVRFMPSNQILNRTHAGANRKVYSIQCRDLPLAVIGGKDWLSPTGCTQTFFSPRDGTTEVFRVPSGDSGVVSKVVQRSQDAKRDWERSSVAERQQVLMQIADAIDDEREALAQEITRDVGKPITHSRAELSFAKKLILAAVEESRRCELIRTGDDWRAIRRPYGVVAVITPWNNPLAIALGKIAPALLYGNTVVWKPALPGAAVAVSALRLLHASGLPPGVVNLLNGGCESAKWLIAHPDVAAVTITGSTSAGTSAQVIAASRRVPIQAEMGGNNGAIVWADADLERAAELIIAGAFGSAGQRCTAPRRAIVDGRCFKEFLDKLQSATSSLGWGDPTNESVNVGPVVSSESVSRLAAVVERAEHAGAEIIRPIPNPEIHSDCLEGYYFPPTLAVVKASDVEIWHCESFGPILAVQCASSWEEAVELCNGVPQGLVASLFTESRDQQADFLQRADAGILKVNTSTAGVSSEAPFCGWKCSAIGPPEHAAGDIEFYTRWQALYGQFDDSILT